MKSKKEKYPILLCQFYTPVLRIFYFIMALLIQVSSPLFCLAWRRAGPVGVVPPSKISAIIICSIFSCRATWLTAWPTVWCRRFYSFVLVKWINVSISLPALCELTPWLQNLIRHRNMYVVVFAPSAQASVLQRCAGHWRVFFSEGGHSGSDRQRFLLQIQHRQRSHHLAEWGALISQLHLILPRRISNLSPPTSSSQADRDRMFWGAERFWPRRNPTSRPRLVSDPWEPHTQPATPNLPQTRKNTLCTFLNVSVQFAWRPSVSFLH